MKKETQKDKTAMLQSLLHEVKEEVASLESQDVIHIMNNSVLNSMLVQAIEESIKGKQAR